MQRGWPLLVHGMPGCYDHRGVVCGLAGFGRLLRESCPSPSQRPSARKRLDSRFRKSTLSNGTQWPLRVVTVNATSTALSSDVVFRFHPRDFPPMACRQTRWVAPAEALPLSCSHGDPEPRSMWRVVQQPSGDPSHGATRGQSRRRRAAETLWQAATLSPARHKASGAGLSIDGLPTI